MSDIDSAPPNDLDHQDLNQTHKDTHIIDDDEPSPAPATIDLPMLTFVVLIIIVTRECCVWVMGLLGYKNLGNLVGLFLLLGAALCYRHVKGQIPHRFVVANSRILKESLFAFLPICAGVGILLLNLGNEGIKIVMIMLISTLIPMWLYAYLAKRWL
ncbi:hypothetical protein [Aquirhabdus parva]|nr:hypothetical protein [Aquirhabdus parva]